MEASAPGSTTFRLLQQHTDLTQQIADPTTRIGVLTKEIYGHVITS